MGGFLTQLFGGDVLGGVSKIIDQFHLSPEEKVKAEQAKELLAAHQQELEVGLEQATRGLQIQAITTETGSEDKVVSRARPYFLYLMYVLLGFDFIVYPLILMLMSIGGLVNHSIQWAQLKDIVRPFDIPTALYELFGAGYLGYVGARSFDKQQALSGDSTIKLPFGIQLGNKS